MGSVHGMTDSAEAGRKYPDGSMDAGAAIAAACCAALRELVAEYDGREVFVIGTPGPDGLVAELEPVAFGNHSAVPAPAQNARTGQVLIHNHPGGKLHPSDADLSVASLYGRAGLGFYIIDNDCTRVRVVVKPFIEPPEVEVDAEALARDLMPGGRLDGAMPGYEYRPQQVEMLRLVAQAFNAGRIAVVEAGTGTGKSFAYLAPSLAWALANKRRVVVTTNTINLQEQLIEKDLPELRRRLGMSFNAVLLKGRGNYISLRRLKFAARDPDLLGDPHRGELQRLAEWARKTTDGSRSDLPFEVSEEAWEAAASDKDDCQRSRCPHFDQCFYYKSRREAAAADLVVANHHLVMADLALRLDAAGPSDFTAILPPYDRLIVDEAHNLEEVATSYFTTEISRAAIRRLLLKLVSHRSGKGALAALERVLFEADSRELLEPTRMARGLLHGDVDDLRIRLETELDQVFSDVYAATVEYFEVASVPRGERRELRITPAVEQSRYWRQTGELLGQLGEALNAFCAALDKLLKVLKGYEPEVQREIADARQGVAGVAAKLAEHAASLRFFLTAGEDHCRWLSIGASRERPFVRLCVAPLDVAPRLRDALFSRKRTVVLTSATMTVNKSFDYVGRQLGLIPPAGDDAPEDGPPDPVGERCDYLWLDSPFDFKHNCLVGVPLDLPEPKDPRFELAIEEVVLKALALTGGRAFVLFTSHRSLDRVHGALVEPLAAQNITALKQGEMPRHRLLETFRSSRRAALFATSSFWEGVDVQGSALECVILVRLPFRVPTTPILEARTERLERLGRDPFKELSIPMAVMKFRQGFGRLIRSRHDRGIVLILDNRVSTRSYGQVFLRSLPPVRVIEASGETVMAEMREFYTNHASARTTTQKDQGRKAGKSVRRGG
jgi:ATP-dependent DNA helicase DinG